MATAIIVGGKRVIRPGVYSEIKSGIQNPPVELSYGNVVIVDNGSLGNGWAAGSGINGEHSEGKNSIYEFTRLDDFKSHIKGGLLWLLSEALFLPGGSGRGISGCSKLYYVKAATTTSSEVEFVLENGSFTIQPLDEGTGANGVLTSGNLSKGYAIKLVKGKKDPSKYKLEFYLGTYKGDDIENSYKPLDGISPEKAIPRNVLSSPEFSYISQLVNWMETDYTFLSWFKLKNGASYESGGLGLINLTGGEIKPGDLTSYPDFNLAVGGTENYGSIDFDTVLPFLKDLDNSFYISTDSGANGNSVENGKLLDLCKNGKFERFLYIAGGSNKTEFKGSSLSQSEGLVKELNSDIATVVHGGVLKSRRGLPVIRQYNSMYKTFLICGREAGLPPQVPLTFKWLDIDGETQLLSEEDQEFCLDNGIMYSYYDTELSRIVCGQGINTLQENSNLVNPDSTSFSKALKRICSQLNKEIIFNCKRDLFATEQGPNRNTISEIDIKTWLDGFLSTKIATSKQDNLILRFSNINVETTQDNYHITYEFVPNFEVSKALFTGFILEK